MGIEASKSVNRTQFPTLNSIILAYDKGTGDENVVRLAVATNAISNAYAQVVARGGQSTDAARAQAREILDNAYSKGQYATALDQMMKEIVAAGGAPAAVREEIRQGIRGTPPATPAAPSAAAPQQAAPSGDHIIRQGHEQEDWDAIPSGQKTPYKLWDGRTGVKP